MIFIFGGLSQHEALRALGQAASEAIRERLAQLDVREGEDEPLTRHWSVAPVPSEGPHQDQRRLRLGAEGLIEGLEVEVNGSGFHMVGQGPNSGAGLIALVE